MADRLIINAWARDLFSLAVIDDSGLLAEQAEGYMPFIQPALGSGGDSLELVINLKTGQILNWRPMTAEDVVKVLEE